MGSKDRNQNTTGVLQSMLNSETIGHALTARGEFEAQALVAIFNLSPHQHLTWTKMEHEGLRQQKELQLIH
jgi:hypothetical protein